jgi:hypothetical protein
LQFRSLRKHLYSAVRVLALAALFFGAVNVGAYAMDSGALCHDRKITHKALAQAGLGYVGTFITQDSHVLQLYIRRDGVWALVGITPDIKACILMAGVEHAFVRELEH